MYGAKKLTARRQEILDQLPDALSRMTLHKKQVNVTDLAHLTAATGDEFALFTRGSQRLVVRGDANGVPLTVSQLEKLHQQGYRFSAHTHPGTSDLVLNASGKPGDRAVIEIFQQKQSLILNSAGRRSIFDQLNDRRVQ